MLELRAFSKRRCPRPGHYTASCCHRRPSPPAGHVIFKSLSGDKGRVTSSPPFPCCWLLSSRVRISHLCQVTPSSSLVCFTEARILGLTEKCYKRTHLSQPDQRVTASTWNTRVLSIRSLWYVLYISVTDLFMSVALQAAFRMWAVELRSAIAVILET